MRRELLVTIVSFREVEFQAGYAEHSLLKTVYTDVRCTVIILRIKPPEGEMGSNEHRQVSFKPFRDSETFLHITSRVICPNFYKLRPYEGS